MTRSRLSFYKLFIGFLSLLEMSIFSTKVSALTWEAPVALSPLLNEVSACSIAMNQSSQTFIVWEEYEDNMWKIYAMDNWNPSHQISLEANASHRPKVVIDSSGNGMAVWSSFDGERFAVQASFFTDSMWQQPVTISSSTERINEIKFAMNHSGDAVVIWEQIENRKHGIQAAYFRDGTWHSSLQISPPNTYSYNPNVAIDHAGNIVAIWITQESTSTIEEPSPKGHWDSSSVQTSLCIQGEWHSPYFLSVSEKRAFDPQIAINTTGEGFAAWVESTQWGNRIFISKYVNGIWEPKEPLSMKGFSAENPQIAVNQSGNAILTWLSLVENYQINACTYFNDVWSNPVILHSVKRIKDQPQIAFSNRDKAIVTWSCSTDGKNSLVQAIEYSAGTWKPVFCLSDIEHECRKPNIAINDRDEVIAVWKRMERPYSFLQAAKTQY